MFNRSEFMKITWRNSDYVKKTTDGMRRLWQNEEYRQRMRMRPTHHRLNIVNKDPSPNLSYVLGAWYGDGTSYLKFQGKSKSKVYFTTLAVKDKDFAEAFAKALTDVIPRRHLLPLVPFYNKGSGMWYVALSSKDLYHFLHSGLTNHTPTITQYPVQFVRGLADAEGSVVIDRKLPIVVIGNTDRRLLDLAATLLRNLGIMSKIYTYDYKRGNRHAISYLRILRRDDVKGYRDLIGFTIKRKMDRLFTYRRR